METYKNYFELEEVEAKLITMRAELEYHKSEAFEGTDGHRTSQYLIALDSLNTSINSFLQARKIIEKENL